MKYINTYEEMNESWRQVKQWLKIPEYLFNITLSKIIDYVSIITYKYDNLSANIDTNQSFSFGQTIKKEPIKLTLNDITNVKLKKTLKLKNIFNEWNVYSFDKDRREHERITIWITKDELKKGDKYFGERLSDHQIDKKYLKNHPSIEDEPQLYVVVAKKTKEHDEMRNERDIRFEKKRRKGLEKEIKKILKSEKYDHRTNQTYGFYDNKPIAFKLVEADYVDLMKKLLSDCPDQRARREVINPIIDDNAWVVGDMKHYLAYSEYPYKTVIDSLKSQEMKELIEPHIENYLQYLVENNFTDDLKRYFDNSKFGISVYSNQDIIMLALNNKQKPFQTRKPIIKILIDNNALLISEISEEKIIEKAAELNDIELVTYLLGEIDIESYIFIDSLDDENKNIIKKDYPKEYKKFMREKQAKKFKI